MELSRILNSQQELHETYLRAGKWTDEEERFAIKLIHHFLEGSIAATPGISLRSFLAKKLRCSPMRISTKLLTDTLAGERIPKRLGQNRYFPTDRISLADRQRIAIELRQLEAAFLKKEEPSNQCTSSVEADASSSADEAASGEDSATAVRVGAWSSEEGIYAIALIDAFLRGMLDQPSGSTLRGFLAEQLCCSPMRISKKLSWGKMAGVAIPKRLGSVTFEPALNRSPHQFYSTHEELARLRRACFAPAKGPGHRSLYYRDHTPRRILSPVAPMVAESARTRLSQTGRFNELLSDRGRIIMGQMGTI